LRADLDELRSDAAGVHSSRADRRASTLDQNGALAGGALVVAAIRTAIRQVHPCAPALLGDFGVGMPVFVRSVPSVVGSLRVVIDAVGKHPDEARAAGIIDRDVAKAEEALACLTTADAVQEGKKVGAREATARRRATQLRVQNGIARIVAAAHLAFLDRPDVVQKFTSLVPSRPHRARGSTGPTDAAPTPPRPAEPAVTREPTPPRPAEPAVTREPTPPRPAEPASPAVPA
jgi:hypothetical protein